MLRNLTFRTAVATGVTLSMAMSPVIMSAQQPPTDVPTITIRANSRLVLVDVVVTDKKGGPITGLKAEDFALEENGKKQKVSVFVPPGTARDAPYPPPPGVLSNYPQSVRPAGVMTLLLLDALNSPFKEQAYARSQMLKYVLEQEQSGRTMAVATLTDQLHMLQQFTSDPQVLMTAIRNFSPAEQTLRPTPAPPEMNAPPDLGRPNEPLASSIAVEQSEVASFANLQIGYVLERRTLITIEAMRSLARTLGGLQGRKNVVWLTAELPFDLIPEDRTVTDAELTADLPGQGRQRSLAVNVSGSMAAEQRKLYGQEIREAEARLASANIAIYPVDLHGLVTGMETLASISTAHNNDIHGAGLANAALSQSESLQASQGTMRSIAAETGGKAYMNQNEIKEGVALASADDKASYTIGYYPDNKKWDGKYRSIKVKVDRGDIEVRNRRGFFAVDPALDKNWKPEQDVAAALGFNAPATQVTFMAQTKVADPNKMQVLFLVDAHTLSAEDSGGGNKKMNVSMYASVYGSDGKSLGTRSVKVDRAFDTATYQQILDKGMMVPIDMEIASGAKELRLAVLDNKTGFIGTASGPLGQ